MGHTKEDIIPMVKKEDVQFIRMQFADTFGHLKNKEIFIGQ